MADPTSTRAQPPEAQPPDAQPPDASGSASGSSGAEPTPLPLGSTLYVGGYTDEGRRVGLESYRLDASDGTAISVTEQPPVPLPSPAYLARHPRHRVLYAVGEEGSTAVSAVALAADGTASLLNTVPSQGGSGCHLALDETGMFLVVAHYAGGAVSTFAVAADGRLSEEVDHHRFSGSGPDPERQEAPHAHQVVPHEGRLLVPDLGTDQIHQLRLDVEGHLSLAADPVVLPAGSGPRHLVVSGDHLVVACELSGRLWLARRDGEQWVEVHSCPASSADPETTPNAPSALRLDDTRVVVANRGPDTFAVFDLDTEGDRLVPVAEVRTGGEWPRDLILTATHLWVAHQHSDTVVAHRRPRSGDDGSETGWVLDFEIPTGTPSALLLEGASSDQG